MRRSLLGLLLIALVLNGVPAWAEYRSFVACPIVRDTKTSPCFLAEYEGELYYLGTQPDTDDGTRLPQLKHEVLVEGSVADGPRVCGGIPLRPVSISVVKEVNLACNTMLPQEPGIEAPPSQHAESLREVSIPSPNGQAGGSFVYGFDDDSLSAASIDTLTELAAYAKRTNASVVKVTGYQASSRLSNGTVMTEKAGLALKRAQNIETLLRGLGLRSITVESKGESEPADGQSDASHRRAVVTVIP
ncbi:MAG: OmpA family protein [Acidobacteriota bacterium]